MSVVRLIPLIPDWLAVTAGREVSVGLSRESALQRARVLRGLLRSGTLDPTQVVLDEDLKSVFQALLALIAEVEHGPVAAVAEEANDFYQFLCGVHWPNDDFQEKRYLLRSLAETGWRALGTSKESVDWTRGEDFCCFPSIDTGNVKGLRAEARKWQELARLGHEQARDRNQHPRRTVEALTRIYDDVLTSLTVKPLFDVRDALLGDLATAMATAFRNLGQFELVQQWLDRAEQWYRVLPDPRRCIARVRLCSLGMEYQLRHFGRVLAALPELQAEFGRLGMRKWERLGRFLEGVLLKSLDRDAEAVSRFETVLRKSRDEGDVELQGYALIEIGGCHGRAGDLKQALTLYEEALKIVGMSQRPILVANLASFIGETYRMSGDLKTAIVWLQRSVNGYDTSGASVESAYIRLVLAEALIAAGRPDVALAEIVVALPVIEEKQLVPDGHMAIALLRESIKKSRADPNALRELREHLQRQH